MIDGVHVEEMEASAGRDRYGGTAQTRRSQIDRGLGRGAAVRTTASDECERDEDHGNPHVFSWRAACWTNICFFRWSRHPSRIVPAPFALSGDALAAVESAHS